MSYEQNNDDTGGPKVEMMVTAIVDTMNKGEYNMVLKERNGSQILAISIGIAEAQSIVLHLRGVALQRPLAHDLLAQMVMVLGGRVTQVVIEDLRDGAFIANVFCRQGASSFVVDARTSDAVAVALRFGAPIYVREKVLDMAGLHTTTHTTTVTITTRKRVMTLQEVSSDQLQKSMQEAIDREDYEAAQKIHDELRRRNQA